MRFAGGSGGKVSVHEGDSCGFLINGEDGR